MECFTKLSNNSLSLNVYVQPRASRNKFAGMHGKAVKLCITAPPVDDKANGAVLIFLSKLFGIPKSAMHIKSGRQGRNKQIIISGPSLAQAEKALEAAL